MLGERVGSGQRIAIRSTSRRVTNPQGAGLAPSEPHSKHFRSAAPIRARTPLADHVNLIIGPVVRRGRFHAVPVRRRGTLSGVRRLRIDTRSPAPHRLAGALPAMRDQPASFSIRRHRHGRLRALLRPLAHLGRRPWQASRGAVANPRARDAASLASAPAQDPAPSRDRFDPCPARDLASDLVALLGEASHLEDDGRQAGPSVWELTRGFAPAPRCDCVRSLIVSFATYEVEGFRISALAGQKRSNHRPVMSTWSWRNGSRGS